MTIDLERKLHQIGRDIRAHRHLKQINSGGCGAFAAIVGNRLLEYGIVPEVVISSGMGNCHDDASIDEVRRQRCETVSEWEMHGIYFGHVGLRLHVQGIVRTYDCDGLVIGADRLGSDRSPVYKGALTVAEITEIAQRPEGWNVSFDRTTIPEIQQIVDHYIDPLPHSYQFRCESLYGSFDSYALADNVPLVDGSDVWANMVSRLSRLIKL